MGTEHVNSTLNFAYKQRLAATTLKHGSVLHYYGSSGHLEKKVISAPYRINTTAPVDTKSC
jgi:hypothetical protein